MYTDTETWGVGIFHDDYLFKDRLRLLGFASNKYQDDAAVSAHIEWRHKFAPRWGTMISYEVGSVGESIGKIHESESVSSVGFGLRWQVQEAKKLNLGMDFGISEDDSAFYIAIGEKL
ncbi:MAG: hypothetical protein ACX936_09885 [Marinobacter sp.]